MVLAGKHFRKWQVLLCLVLLITGLFSFVQGAGAVAGQVDANRVTSGPVINGQLTDAGWNLANTVSKTTIGSPNNTVTMGAMWDTTNLYIGVRVLDGNLYNDSANIWDDDSVEIYIDGNHNHGTSYDASDRQYIKGYNDSGLFASGSSTGVQHAWAAISGGYSVELAIPWSNLGLTPAAGLTIGFDVGYNDDDNAGGREAQAVWWGTINNYNNTSAFGHIYLLAGSTTPPPTTPPPTTPPPTTPPPTTPPSGQQPWSGTPYPIPGTIQAENYDRGGEGIAYHDLETANQGGQYRTGEGVDIETTGDTGGGYNMGWTRTDEWVEYTVNVAAAGNYTLVERVASAATTGRFRVEFNGVNKTGTVTVPNTGGWQSYVNLSQTVSLSAGQQVMRVYFSGNDTNLNYFTFSSGTVTPPPTTPPPTTPPPTTPPPTNLSYRVHLFYYPWYGTPATDGQWVHWNQNQFNYVPPDSISSNFYPTLGPYSSKDTAIINQHMQMIAQARIGVIMTSWWGQGSREDSVTPLLLNAAAPYGIKVGFHMEPYGGRTAQSTVNDINYINNTYGSHPAYYRAQDRGNKPVFYIFNSLAISDWSPLAAVNSNNIILTQTTDQSKVTYFGGMYNYSVNGNEPNIRDVWTSMNNYCVANGKVWSPSIGPGYVDSRATGNTLFIARENGAKYDRDWQDAMASGAQWISITSFNEWHEGSQIEPARNNPPAGFGYLTYLNAYGRTGASAETAYMDRTRYWVDIFNP